MPAQPFPPDILATHYPDFSGFDFINAGSFKTVYRIITPDGREEVLKVIRLPQDQSTPEARAYRDQELGRAQRETSLLAKCDSPFVVRLGSLGPHQRDICGEICLVYSEEFLSGMDLKSVIAAGGNPPEQEIKALLRSLVSGIQALWVGHRAVHRDIKPANICHTGQMDRPYVILDLGIAYNIEEPGLTANPRESPATPLYMAPEMLDPNFRDSISYRADLYSAGLSVFEFASGGIHPLAQKGDSLTKTVTRVLHQEPLNLRTLRPDLSPALCSLVNQLMKKNPALRPGNLNLILNQLH